jgi:acyl-CoA synthetase (AMP-forming)/AMP-acid ligase II
VPSLAHVLVVEDGYEAALAAASPVRDFAGRTSDDIYCACTGGTTGLPKGVLWRHEDIFFASMGGGDPAHPPEVGMVMLITPPLMHVSAHWSAFMGLYSGGTLVFMPTGPFDPVAAWDLVAAEGVNVMVLVGNAMAGPMVDRYREHPVDASSLIVFGSGGAVLSPAVKQRMRETFPNVMVVDGYGSTETGVAGADSRGGGEGAVFTMDANAAVFDDDLHPVAPGSGVIGRFARKGRIPIGYYNDPDKTAATFVTIDGERWVLPGDLASVEDDGSIRLHGRGSASINTGGEKVFPEEVESALMANDALQDVLVVGVPDERWGERVVAVVAFKPGRSLTFDELQAHAREHVAGYKVPRAMVVVDAIVRSPNGKPDYAWAKAQALAAQ